MKWVKKQVAIFTVCRLVLLFVAYLLFTTPVVKA